jgi:hypothetical protein
MTACTPLLPAQIISFFLEMPRHGDHAQLHRHLPFAQLPMKLGVAMSTSNSAGFQKRFDETE